jgi:hypothetical protein
MKQRTSLCQQPQTRWLPDNELKIKNYFKNYLRIEAEEKLGELAVLSIE